jgi:glucans biosynthesis protein
MTNDPMRQADIERRLANLAKARRCGARTRAGHSCRQAAVRGRARCRMHGGAKGSGGPRGDRNGNFKHGIWTRESLATRRALRAKVREIRGLLQAIGSGKSGRE